MYKISKADGQLIGYVESVLYIRKSENGSYVACDAAKAQGIAVNGVAYNLPGHTEIGGETVTANAFTDQEFMKLLAKYQASVILATKQAKAFTDDDQRLEVSALYDDWTPGKYEVGDIYNTHEGVELGSSWEQTWEVFQAYDNSVYPDITPGELAWYTFNRPLHGKSPETARPFVPVQGAHDMYRTGEYMIYTDGTTYKCLSDTNFSPDDYPQAWEIYTNT